MMNLNINMAKFIMENNLRNCYEQAIITTCKRELSEHLTGAWLSTNYAPFNKPQSKLICFQESDC
jgi:hypothetical protein